MSKYLLFIIAALSIIVNKSYSQDKEIPKDLYIAATIPDSLKEDANSVVRYLGIEVDVKGPGKKTVKFHSMVTVLNEKGDDEAIMKLGYNRKFNSVSGIEMRVYNEKGELIKKYHKSDMYDGADGDNEALITDDRFLEVKHSIATYPITIEQQFEEDANSLIDLGSWHIQGSEQSIQSSNYLLSIDNSTGFRFLNKNTSIKPVITHTLDNKTAYSWRVSNLKAIKLEKNSLSWRILPRIDFAANSFEYYGIPGSINTWQNYGKWQRTLNADVCTLDPPRVDEIRKMTADIKTDKEKAKFLYNYLQQNMRYVYVQLGIGGLKPFPAMFVDQKKYGDCKALSNYMVAMLKAVNIPAYYAKVRAGTNEEPSNFSFPFDMSNHIIVCIPFKGDTTWLECTNNTQQFGKLGSFTENRNALLITEDGGKLVNTPRSTMQDNQFNGEVHIALDEDGGAKAQIKMLGTGEYRDEFIGLAYGKTDKQKEYLLRSLEIKQPSTFDLTSGKDIDGTKEFDLDLEFDKFCDIKTGDKQFYRPGAFMLWDETIPVLEKRKSDYYFAHPLQKACVTTIDLPQGFEVETLPVNQSLKFTYGNYEVKYVYDAAKNQVVSTAKFNLTNHVIPAAKYAEMQQYLDAVAKAQNKKLVIRRKA
ncbi:MAG: hypothetical protein JWP44_4043 [Mucilaginibacter sp.]|nr:hypothetical protein [Mucilaginibacter sp.]